MSLRECVQEGEGYIVGRGVDDEGEEEEEEEERRDYEVVFLYEYKFNGPRLVR